MEIDGALALGVNSAWVKMVQDSPTYTHTHTHTSARLSHVVDIGSTSELRMKHLPAAGRTHTYIPARPR